MITRPATDHVHYFNYHTGRPRFHFDENTPPTPPPHPTPPPVWHTGIDAEFIGHAQNKGWKLDDPKEAFVAATKQARELERHFGVPPEQLLKMPKADAKPEEIAAFRQRLGAPKEASEYDLSAIKEATIADTLRATAFTTGLSKDAATAVAAAVAKAIESQSTTDGVVKSGKLAEEKAALEKNWGTKFTFNKLLAEEGARRSGITPEAVVAMESQIGYAAVMEHFRKLGAHTSEDTFVERDGGGGGDVTTREGAISRKAELMADPEWGKRLTAGNVEARREYDRLNAMIGG